jgi:hypothetical protein
MRWVYALLNKLIPLEFSIVPHELPTIHNTCKHLGIIVDEHVETHELSPGVRLFTGFDKHTGRMLRYKAIDLGNRLIIETY